MEGLGTEDRDEEVREERVDLSLQEQIVTCRGREK